MPARLKTLAEKRRLVKHASPCILTSSLTVLVEGFLNFSPVAPGNWAIVGLLLMLKVINMQIKLECTHIFAFNSMLERYQERQWKKMDESTRLKVNDIDFLRVYIPVLKFSNHGNHGWGHTAV